MSETESYCAMQLYSAGVLHDEIYIYDSRNLAGNSAGF